MTGPPLEATVCHTWYMGPSTATKIVIYVSREPDMAMDHLRCDRTHAHVCIHAPKDVQIVQAHIQTN